MGRETKPAGSLQEKYNRTPSLRKSLIVSACQIASALLLLASVPARADEYGRLAGELSKAAAKQGHKRVAVLPFQSVGARGGEAGLVVSEKLIGPISAQAVVEVVERTMLQAVLKEQRLQ